MDRWMDGWMVDCMSLKAACTRHEYDACLKQSPRPRMTFSELMHSTIWLAGAGHLSMELVSWKCCGSSMLAAATGSICCRAPAEVAIPSTRTIGSSACACKACCMSRGHSQRSERQKPPKGAGR